MLTKSFIYINSCTRENNPIKFTTNFYFSIYTDLVAGTVVTQNFVLLSGDQDRHFIERTLGMKSQVAYIAPEDDPEMEDIIICNI